MTRKLIHFPTTKPQSGQLALTYFTNSSGPDKHIAVLRVLVLKDTLAIVAKHWHIILGNGLRLGLGQLLLPPSTRGLGVAAATPGGSRDVDVRLVRTMGDLLTIGVESLERCGLTGQSWLGGERAESSILPEAYMLNTSSAP